MSAPGQRERRVTLGFDLSSPRGVEAGAALASSAVLVLAAAPRAPARWIRHPERRTVEDLLSLLERQGGFMVEVDEALGQDIAHIAQTAADALALCFELAALPDEEHDAALERLREYLARLTPGCGPN